MPSKYYAVRKVHN